jgi:soluble lytic murein transglycosylase-like protein
VKAKQEVPAVVESSLFSRFRRFGRSSSPLCVGAFALSMVPLQIAEIQVPVPEKPPAAVAQVTAQPDAAPPTPLAETPTPPVETPKASPPETLEALKAPPEPVQPEAPDPQTSPKKPRRRPTLDFDESLGKPKAPFAEQIYEIAVRHAINPHLVAALIHVESAFKPRAVSRKGACGLMQLLPDTARRFGIKKKKDIFDPTKNLEAGIRYLKWLNKRFNGDVQRVLAAYNAGEGAVERFGGIPPYRETQQYVKKIFGILGFTSDPLAQAKTDENTESGGDGIVPAGR